MKVPEPRKLPSGNYFLQMRLNGVSVPVTAPTAKECKRQAELIKAEHRAGKRLVEAKTPKTVGELIDDYIAKRRGIRSPATIRGYTKIRNGHFQAAMGLRPEKVKWQALIDEELKSYAPKSVANAWALVCSSLKAAGIPKPPVLLPAAQSDTREWLSDDEILIFLDAIKGDRYEIAALLALHSLRMSEILGLSWDNVDLKSGTITVKGAVVIGEDDKPVKKSTNKNFTSRRTVAIMIPRLRELLEAVPAKTGPVVVARDVTIWKHVKDACERADLPAVSPHGLRHSFASLALVTLRMSEAECMEMGGWSNPATMHKIYTHVSAKARLKAENKMAEFYKNANENANRAEKHK